MTRYQFIERMLRQIYNGQPSDDASITFGLVNQWLNDGIALAIKKNYTDSIGLDGVAYINNSFYSTYSNITISNVDYDTWLINLPQIPVGLGKNEGIAMVQFVDVKGRNSQTGVPLSVAQLAYQEQLRPIQNKIMYWYENNKLYAKSTLMLSAYTGKVRMVSGGDSTDLNSTLIIPDDYVPVIVEYVKGQLAFEKSRPIDSSNDGVDSPN